MSTPTIGLVSGSTRTGSINTRLLHVMAKKFEAAGLAPELIDFRDYDMPLYNGDLEDNQGVPEPVHAWVSRLLACDGVFISTPEYNGCLPPLLKNAIDWSSRTGLEHFQRPVYGIGSAAPGALSGIMAMRQLHFILSRLGARVVPTQLGVGNFSKSIDETYNFAPGGVADRAKNLVAQMKSEIDRQSP